MTEAIAQASASILAQYKSKLQAMNRISGEVVSRNEQAIVKLIQQPSSAQQITLDGLNSRGGRIDISV